MRARRAPEPAGWPGQRPYRLLGRAELEGRFARALEAGAGEEGAHCIHELWMRGEYPARVEARLGQLWAR
ncbi:MAG: hypothetical protein JO005_01270, partial [Gammaproteobacteria bacterium]|nr:hypothetical protein [Gammaproteobacteria bacterium]